MSDQESSTGRSVELPPVPTITISDGYEAQMYSDRFFAEDGDNLRPIERASIVARLRTLADEIEKGGLPRE